MELNELYEIIKSELVAAGFTKRPSCCKEEDRSVWTIGKELVEDLSAGYAVITGFTLSVSKVYHSNGSDKKDISYKLWIDKWVRSSGRGEAHIKVSSTQTEKTTRKKVQEFIKKYLQIIEPVL